MIRHLTKGHFITSLGLAAITGAGFSFAFTVLNDASVWLAIPFLAIALGVSPLTGLAHLLSYGMVKRVAKSVGSRDLSNTYNRLLGETGTPAFRLINSALQLDNSSEFPAISIREVASDFETSPLPLSVLRHLVVSHFHLFPVDFRTKQSICATVGIKYSSLHRSNPVPRMLPRGR